MASLRGSVQPARRAPEAAEAHEDEKRPVDGTPKYRLPGKDEPEAEQHESAHQQVLAPQFGLEERGEVEVKGKGRLSTWWLVGRKGGRRM